MICLFPQFCLPHTQDHNAHSILVCLPFPDIMLRFALPGTCLKLLPCCWRVFKAIAPIYHPCFSPPPDGHVDWFCSGCWELCCCKSLHFHQSRDRGRTAARVWAAFQSDYNSTFPPASYPILSLHSLWTLETGALFCSHSVATSSGVTGGQDYRGLGDAHRRKLLRLRKICGLWLQVEFTECKVIEAYSQNVDPLSCMFTV